MKINRRYVLLAILFLIIIVLFLPIKVHYSFHAIAKIYPLKEWSLNRGQDDSYVSEMHNYKFNVLSHVKSYKFERGDVSEVFHQESYASGDLVENGDTLAYINSYYIENELAKLYSLKSVEEENLKMSLAGEKQELIEQAEQEYNFQMQQLELEKKNYTRYQKLFEDSIISTADFEVHENAFRLAEINRRAAMQELLQEVQQELRTTTQATLAQVRRLGGAEPPKEDNPVNGIEFDDAEGDGNSEGSFVMSVGSRNESFLSQEATVPNECHDDDVAVA